MISATRSGYFAPSVEMVSFAVNVPSSLMNFWQRFGTNTAPYRQIAVEKLSPLATSEHSAPWMPHWSKICGFALTSWCRLNPDPVSERIVDATFKSNSG